MFIFFMNHYFHELKNTQVFCFPTRAYVYLDVYSGHASPFYYTWKISWNYGKKRKRVSKLCICVFVCVHCSVLTVLIFVDVKYIKTEICGFTEIYGVTF